MSGQVYLGNPPIDWEDEFAETAVTPANTDTVVLQFRAKMGKPFYIVGFGQAWEAAMDTFVVYSLLIDGISHPKYHRKAVQITPPEQVGYSPLPVPILVPQGALIQVVANSSVTGNFAARIKGEYKDYQGA